MLIDTHCHLDFPDFEAERDAIIERAGAAGVGQMITISTRVKKFETILGIAESYANVFCSVGTHPHNADEELDIETADLVRLSWRLARPGSIISTTMRRVMRRRSACAAILPPRAKPACRW